MELNQAGTSAEAHTLLRRIHTISSFVVEEKDGGTEISDCPGFVRYTMSSKVERSSERSEERACVLLRFKAGAAIIGAIRRFGSPEVQYEALSALETLVSSGDREILSPAFNNCIEAQVCETVIGMINLPSNQPDDEAQLIEQPRVLRSAPVCGTIGALAERGWHKALIRAGAAGFLVSVFQLYLPRSFKTPDFILDLLPCYDAFSSLFSLSSIIETGAVWVTEIAVESELVTASRIDAFIVEARRTLGQHPVTDHWGLSVRASALAALSRAFAVLQNLVDAEANYLHWVERDEPAGEVQGGWPATLRNSSGSFFFCFGNSSS